jgi:integrase
MAKSAKGGGSLFQRKGKRTWIASFIDAGGEHRTLSTRTTDKAAAQRVLNHWTNQAALRRAGLVDSADERYRDAGKLPIATHLARWREHLIGKGSSERHCNHVHTVASRVLSAASVATIADLSADRVLSALELLRQGGSSSRTINHARGAVRSFSRWAQSNRLTRSDATAGLTSFKGTDIRRERRALDPQEAVLLVHWTDARGPVFGGVSGVDRALAYRMAMGTGFRAGELRGLRVADCDTRGCTIRLRAGLAKNRTETAQPITAELASVLRESIKARGLRGSDAVLLLPGRTADAVRLDIRRARVWWARSASTTVERRARWRSGLLRWQDDAGRVADFHALRVSYITSLIGGGVNVKAAQTLARHSDPKLTLAVYTKLGLNDTRRALDALPSLSPSEGIRLAVG